MGPSYSLRKPTSDATSWTLGANRVRRRGCWLPILQRTPALAFTKGTVRIAAAVRCTDLLKSGGCLVIQRQAGCRQVVAKMLNRASTDDRRDNAGTICDPAQCDLGRCRANLPGDANDRIDRRPIAIGVGIFF
jgi:hypothetical protein